MAIRPPLTKIVFGWPPPASTVETLRAQFPEITFVIADEAEFIAALPGAEAAIAWSMTGAEYAAADRLAWFQSIGAGVERVILPGMAERGLLVTNTSGMHAANISEHVLAMMLAFARQFPRLIRAQVEHAWREETRPLIFEIERQSLLVVGYGMIGQALARKAHALGMYVSAVRRSVGSDRPVDLVELGTFADLPRMVASADHIVICLPQTTETIGLFSDRLIDQMKPGSYIYNIGRGPIIDTGALVAALERGHLGGAGLDVTDPEPLPPDSPLWDRADVIITAHTAGASPNFWPRLLEIISDNIERYQLGRPMRNLVDLSLGY